MNQKSIDDCLQQLKDSGVDEFALLPDLDGFSRNFVGSTSN